MKPKLTIGMAVVEDRKGVYTTIQHIRETNKRLSECEFVVVDNKPGTEQSAAILNYLGNIHLANNLGANYVAMPSPKGTAPPRNKVFEVANGEYVVCMDSHVMVASGAIDRLLDWYDHHPLTNDLYSGPILYDDLVQSETHFGDVWRDGMWGIWERAWKCNCSLPDYFTIRDFGGGTCSAWSLEMEPNLYPKTRCQGCGKPFKHLYDVPYADRFKVAPELGYVLLGTHADEEPFEIPGQGLGLFSCRKGAWLGFNPHFREFGGEEMYIHEKYRREGFKCINLPFLRWNHDFYAPPTGKNYPGSAWGKIRNYVIGHMELGRPLDAVYNHFVQHVNMVDKNKSRNTISESDWLYLIEDPIGRETRPGKKPTKTKGCSSCGKTPTQPLPPENSKSIEDFEKWSKSIMTGLTPNLDKIKSYAEKVWHAIEITRQNDSTVPLLSSKGKVYSFTNVIDPVKVKLQEVFSSRFSVQKATTEELLSIENTELLYLQTKATADVTYESLVKFAPSVSRYIVIPYTNTFGELGEGSRDNKPVPGILPGVRKFLTENPKWSIIDHTNDHTGLTVLGCRAEDKPKLPSLITMAANFTKAMANYVADGMNDASPEVVKSRLETCTMCTHRLDTRCSVCGCFLESKAKQKVSVCPLMYWKE